MLKYKKQNIQKAKAILIKKDLKNALNNYLQTNMRSVKKIFLS